MNKKLRIGLRKMKTAFLGNQPDFIKIFLLKKWYRRKTGDSLDLKQPKTFNQKIQWLKVYDSTEIKTELTDKWLVRDYVSKKIGEKYLIPVIGCWDHFSDADFSSFPERFILKTNHASGWNILVEDKSTFNESDARDAFDIWLNDNFSFSYGYEFQYMNIKPRMMAEYYLQESNANSLLDYRFFCFDGVPKFVWVDEGSGTNNHKRNIYDSSWILQDYCVNYPPIERKIEKPDTFDEMLSVAKTLSGGFSFVRVDLYSVNHQVYFGELTFTPQSGTGRWDNDEQNVLYGNMITLPRKSKIPKLKRKG